MIRAQITDHCSHGQSQHIVKNGHAPKGKPHYRCEHCGRGGGLNPTVRYPAAEKEPFVPHVHAQPPLPSQILSVNGVLFIERFSRACSPMTGGNRPWCPIET